MECISTQPGEYDGSITAAAAMRAVATIILAVIDAGCCYSCRSPVGFR